MNWSKKKCRNCPQSEPLDAQSCTGCGALFPLPVVVTDIRVPHVRWVGIGCLLAVGFAIATLIIGVPYALFIASLLAG